MPPVIHLARRRRLRFMNWVPVWYREWPTDFGRGPVAHGLIVWWFGRIVYHRVDRRDDV